jgi:hypothetical protein
MPTSKKPPQVFAAVPFLFATAAAVLGAYYFIPANICAHDTECSQISEIQTSLFHITCSGLNARCAALCPLGKENSRFADSQTDFLRLGIIIAYC